ncbi:MAG: hypothetical protein ACK4HW_03850 [Roseinatronobacter sp.]
MLNLEEFELEGVQPDRGYLDPKSAEILRNQGYDEGYAAGWQDCVAHTKETSAAQMAATLDALQRLSFTYAEARALAEHQLVEFVETLLQRIVPPVLDAAMPARVSQELETLLRRDPDARLGLRCAPSTAKVLSSIMADLPSNAHITLSEEPAFSPMQVAITGQEQHRMIDLEPIYALLDIKPHQSGDTIREILRGKA